jgi:hypothetical protein
MSVKYSTCLKNISTFKALQNIPKLGSLVWKETIIWQPWSPMYICMYGSMWVFASRWIKHDETDVLETEEWELEFQVMFS